MVDDDNAGAVAECRGMSTGDFGNQIEDAQNVLVKAFRDLPGPDIAMGYRRRDGSAASAKGRLPRMAEHWAFHLDEMRAAAR